MSHIVYDVAYSIEKGTLNVYDYIRMNSQAGINIII